MATQFEIILPWGTPHAESAATAALDLIDHLESQLTVYRETSEISRLNRIAAQAPVPVEARLFDLLELAERLHRETGGAFDITAGSLTKAWGFFRREGRVPDDAELRAGMECVGMKFVALDAANRRVRFLRRGVELNLGSIGKGYALDRAAELLRSDWRMTAGVLDGGTSSVLAFGECPGDSRGWCVSIAHPYGRRRLARVYLRDRAMATSGTSQQFFVYNNRTFGHLLDPRTGWPVEGMALASAFAPTAAEADALATAFFVLGVDGAREYCWINRQVAALLLTDEPDAEPIAVNLPASEWEIDDSPLERATELLELE